MGVESGRTDIIQYKKQEKEQQSVKKQHEFRKYLYTLRETTYNEQLKLEPDETKKQEF